MCAGHKVDQLVVEVDGLFELVALEVECGADFEGEEAGGVGLVRGVEVLEGGGMVFEGDVCLGT